MVSGGGGCESLFQNCRSRLQEALIYSKTRRNLSVLTSAATRKVIFKTRSENFGVFVVLENP